MKLQKYKSQNVRIKKLSKINKTTIDLFWVLEKVLKKIKIKKLQINNFVKNMWLKIKILKKFTKYKNKKKHIIFTNIFILYKLSHA